MKANIRVILLANICLSLFMLASCGGKENTSAAGSESVQFPQLPIDTLAAVKEYSITQFGIDTICVGMSVADIPEKVDGLYDTFAPGPDISDIEALQYDFSLNGNVRFSILDFGDGLVDVVFVSDYTIDVQLPNGKAPLVLGEDMSRVLELPGVHSKWNPYDSLGFWAWEWQGLWFMFDKDGINESNSMKLFNAHQPPTASDLRDMKIGYIGTGLPY